MKGKWAKAVVGAIAAFSAFATVAIASGASRWAHGTFSAKTVSKYCVWVETKGDPATNGDLKAYRAYPGMHKVCIVGKTGKGAKGAAGSPGPRGPQGVKGDAGIQGPRATRAPPELPAAPAQAGSLFDFSVNDGTSFAPRTCPSPSKTRPRATRTRASS